MQMLTLQEKIEKTLIDAFHPKNLKIINESHLHKGHIGDNQTGESHFAIEIDSKQFKGLTLIEQHREVKQILKPFFEKGLHALRLKTHAP